MPYDHALGVLPISGFGQEEVKMTQDLSEIIILGTRPSEKTPITKQKLQIKQLQRDHRLGYPHTSQGDYSLVTTNERSLVATPTSLFVA